MTAGLGVLTFNRAEYFTQVTNGILEHLSGKLDFLAVYNDGSAECFDGSYQRDYVRLGPDEVMIAKKNAGVAKGKNWLFRKMLDAGCDWLFIEEDDCVVTSPEVLQGYITACHRVGLGHLGFRHHSAQNPAPRREGRWCTTWPNLTAGWSIYSAASLHDVGLMDEGFHNALEHVEHTCRLALAGYAHYPRPGELMMDATGSEDWLMEIPGSYERSVASRDEADFNVAKAYWREKDIKTFHMIWPGQ